MIWAWLLASCVRAPVEAAGDLTPRGVEPARSTREALNAVMQPRRVALLIGIDRYDDPQFPDLKHAVHDANLLGSIFEDRVVGGFDEVNVQVSGPTRADMLASLRNLGHLRRDDVLVVYFSGHGTRATTGTGGRRFLLQRDSRAADLATTAIDLEELQRWFSNLAPARKALIVDACFSGDGKSVVRPEDRGAKPGQLLPAAATRGPGEAHLFATSTGRPALEDDELGHGVYTYYLIESLSWSFAKADRDGDGVITAWEAHDFARTRTLRRTGERQVPEAAFRVVGMADVVLAGRPQFRKQRDRSLVYLYPPPHHPMSGATVLVDGRARGSFPGTVTLLPGRHHFRFKESDGTTFAEGHLKLVPGATLRVEDLARQLRGPAYGVIAHGFAAGGFLPNETGFGGAIGAYIRNNSTPLRGLVLTGEAAVGGGSRPLIDLGLGLGVQHDRGRWRLRAGGELRHVTLPTTTGREGWWFFGLGPTATIGFVSGDRMAWTLRTRVALAGLDTDDDGLVDPIWWRAASFGPEWTW
ncbi:MAG: caspase family protein [Myxococcota bacterium]